MSDRSFLIEWHYSEMRICIAGDLYDAHLRREPGAIMENLEAKPKKTLMSFQSRALRRALRVLTCGPGSEGSLRCTRGLMRADLAHEGTCRCLYLNGNLEDTDLGMKPRHTHEGTQTHADRSARGALC